jgi:hypothetical protein
MIKRSLEIEETSVYKVVKTIIEQKGKTVFWIQTNRKVWVAAK